MQCVQMRSWKTNAERDLSSRFLLMLGEVMAHVWKCRDSKAIWFGSFDPPAETGLMTLL